MTIVSNLKIIKDFWPLLLASFAAAMFAVNLTVAGLWTLYGDVILDTTKRNLGIYEIISTLERIEGYDKIIREVSDGYVREPVFASSKITIVETFERTPRGAGCLLENFTFVFVDDRGTVIPGETRQPFSQITEGTQRRELTTTVPPEVLPGSTTVNLQLIYSCGDIKVLENTKPIRFTLLPLEDASTRNVTPVRPLQRPTQSPSPEVIPAGSTPLPLAPPLGSPRSHSTAPLEFSATTLPDLP